MNKEHCNIPVASKHIGHIPYFFGSELRSRGNKGENLKTNTWSPNC